MATRQLTAPGLLFDSDGVLVDSDTAVVTAWTQLAERYGLDTPAVIERVHGRPARQTIADFLAEEHREEALALINHLELTAMEGVRAMPGAVECVSGLDPARWAVVTSGFGELARARLAAAGIPVPPVVVTADDIERGKPHPDPYVVAAERLGRRPSECVVFEDAVAGVEAARAAGVRHVVGIGRDTDRLDVDVHVPDLRSVRIAGDTIVVEQAG